ncbi:MAG: phosphatidate cytidylyltransferase [bacterium]|nr:phosphatidate cytidylyltransferase [bacterium]
MPELATGLIWVLSGVFAALLAGSVVRFVALRKSADLSSEKSIQSLRVWWILLLAFSAALLLGKAGLSVLLCLAGILAIREFHLIYAKRSLDVPALAYTITAMALLLYALLAFQVNFEATWGLPLLVLISLSTVEILSGQTQDYLRATAGYFWAFVLMVFGMSHVVGLLELPPQTETLDVGPAGWCLFLVVLTECNDIAQALVGRKFGRRKIVPQVSPGKSWEGLLGGIATTSILSILLAPWLTTLVDGRTWPLSLLISALAGLIISLGGFLGDINMSALKREAGVKDSSQLLPGMGGIIDRIDSLTISAPAFYFFAKFLINRSAN